MNKETTLRAIGIGLFLALVMCAANTYLGLYAGMTVSASIPAAVISMGIMRGIFRRGTILENNIAQTAASAGESLAAGIIFTIPALVIVGAWTEFNYWVTTLIAMLGGILGVLFMIPMRRALIVEEKELIYPEGVACAEVLRTGEKGGAGIRYLLGAMSLGMGFNFFVKGFSAIKGTVEGAVRWGRGIFYAGSDMAVMLVGVGYIVGLNISVLVFIGGALSWLIALPIYTTLHPGTQVPLDAAWNIWNTQIRYLGIGAMIVGGIRSIISVRQSISKGLRISLAATSKERGKQDLPMNKVLTGLLITIIPLFILYYYLTRSFGVTLVVGIAMVILAFFFVAVASYIVGLVGSSNNPVSGMTICTLLAASILLLLLGMKGVAGIIAALCVAGVVCCAACTAADVSQDLKTGYLVGASPRKQQLMQIAAVIVSAFIIAPILKVLHGAYGIGTGEPGALLAPQASLFASLTKGMFTDIKSLPWNMVILGAGVGIVLVVIDEYLRRRKAAFRVYVMPVAVGIYLPISLAVPILLGGLMRTFVTKFRGNGDITKRGLLFSSGLIAGESLMGIILAGLIYAKVQMKTLIESDLLSLGAFFAVIAIFLLFLLKKD